MKWLKNILRRMFRAGAEKRDYSGRNAWLAAQHIKVNSCNRREK